MHPAEVGRPGDDQVKAKGFLCDPGMRVQERKPRARRPPRSNQNRVRRHKLDVPNCGVSRYLAVSKQDRAHGRATVLREGLQAMVRLRQEVEELRRLVKVAEDQRANGPVQRAQCHADRPNGRGQGE